jgi:hypothetical protein
MNPRALLAPFTLLLALCSLALISACAEDASDPALEVDDAPVSLVPPGKADNFFSTVAQEYTVTGQTSAAVDASCLSLHASDPDPTARCQMESVGLKNFAIAWFLNQYVIDKHDSANEGWGGFTAMTRPASFDSLAITPTADGAFSYTFTSELSGPLNLLSKMPTEACADDATARCFTLAIPVMSNATLRKLDLDREWYRSSPYSEYNPDTYTGEKETLTLKIQPYPRSNDAFLEYGKLFNPTQLALTGGQLRVGVFVGWDYYDDRYDLQTAKEVYTWLTTTQGFTSAVASYDDYKIDSPDLTKTIKVQGQPVEVAVKIVHPGQGDPGEAAFAGQMKSEMITAFGERQVILYEGHAGPLYGFALANWRMTSAGELDDSELPSIKLPERFYQLVMASGCDTYMVADALYKNPAKAGRVDLDVITTSSFSNAAGSGRTTKAVIDAVINQRDKRSGLKPTTYGALLRTLNSERWMTPLYGVHGIDDNPRANPFADESVLCKPCKATSDCGGNDAMCVLLDRDNAICTTLCRSDADCPQGYECWDVSSSSTIVSMQCVPADLSCK